MRAMSVLTALVAVCAMGTAVADPYPRVVDKLERKDRYSSYLAIVPPSAPRAAMPILKPDSITTFSLNDGEKLHLEWCAPRCMEWAKQAVYVSYYRAETPPRTCRPAIFLYSNAEEMESWLDRIPLDRPAPEPELFFRGVSNGMLCEGDRVLEMYEQYHRNWPLLSVEWPESSDSIEKLFAKTLNLWHEGPRRMFRGPFGHKYDHTRMLIRGRFTYDRRPICGPLQHEFLIWIAARRPDPSWIPFHTERWGKGTKGTELRLTITFYQDSEHPDVHHYRLVRN